MSKPNRAKPGPKPKTEAHRARRRNLSLSDLDWRLVETLSAELSTTYSGVIRIAIKELAAKRASLPR